MDGAAGGGAAHRPASPAPPPPPGCSAAPSPSFLGTGDKGALDTFASYAAAGIGVDAVLTLAGPAAGAWGHAVAGMAGNLAKLAVKVALEVWVGIPTGFVLVGRLYPTIVHVVFGLLGGLLGFLVLEALQRAGYFAYLAERR